MPKKYYHVINLLCYKGLSNLILVKVICYVNVENHFFTFTKYITFTGIKLGSPFFILRIPFWSLPEKPDHHQFLGYVSACMIMPVEEFYQSVLSKKYIIQQILILLCCVTFYARHKEKIITLNKPRNLDYFQIFPRTNLNEPLRLTHPWHT